MTAALDAALSNIWTEEGLGILQKGADGAVLAALRRAHALGMERARAICREYANALESSGQHYVAIAASECERRIRAALATETNQPGADATPPRNRDQDAEDTAGAPPAHLPEPPPADPLALLGADVLQALRIKAGPFDDRPAEILAFLLHSAQVYGLMSEEEAKALAEPTEEP